MMTGNRTGGETMIQLNGCQRIEPADDSRTYGVCERCGCYGMIGAHDRLDRACMSEVIGDAMATEMREFARIHEASMRYHIAQIPELRSIIK